MDNDVQCPICNYQARLMHDSFQGYKVGMVFKIYFCDQCVTSFSSPLVDTAAIYDDIYKNGARVPGYDRYWHFFNNIKDEEDPLGYLVDADEDYWGVNEALKQLVTDKKEAKILEIGSGLGYLTYALRNDGYNVHGLDISKEAVGQANSNFGDYYICRDLFDFSKENLAGYDIVILTEVIEHIDLPAAFIKEIIKLLAKDGVIIMTTPNKSIAPNDIVWDTESPPVHHWWFSENSITHMANGLGLKLEFIDYMKFYKNKPAEYRYGRARRKLERQPVLSEDGSLIQIGGPKKRGALKKIYKSAIASMPKLKSVYFKLKILFGAEITICSSRGKILCAILKRA